jgi:DNA-binding NarL/FixJ family response regulator
MDQPTPIRIMIIDTLLAVREGLGAYLDSQPDFELVAMAQSGIRAEAIWAQARPDVVLLELEAADDRGLEVARALRRAHPDTGFIFLTSGRGSVVRDVDAASTLPKGIGGAELCAAIRAQFTKRKLDQGRGPDLSAPARCRRTGR